MADTLRSEITSGFEEWVDEPEPVSEELLRLSRAHNFDEKRVRTEFRKFLGKVGAEGDTLSDMTERGMDLLRDQIGPNRSTLWDDLAEKKTKLKLGGLKLKSTDSSAEADSDSSATKKTGGKAKKEKTPKRQRGYDLFFNENKDTLKDELRAEWEKKYKDVPYQANPTAVSKELGRRWREDLSDEDRRRFNDQAAEINTKNGIEPRASKQTNEEDKKPLTAYQMFNKEVYDEMAQRYRDENGLEAEEKVKPTEIMRLTAARWNSEIKPNADRVAEYQEKADAYNKEHHREYRPKEKEEKVSTSKTNAYREFCRWFRKDYRDRNPEGNPYEEAKQMNEMWNNDVKKDDEKKAKWDREAEEENLRRGIPVE